MFNFNFMDDRTHTAVLLQGFDQDHKNIENEMVVKHNHVTTATFCLNDNFWLLDYSRFKGRGVIIEPDSWNNSNSYFFAKIKSKLFEAGANFVSLQLKYSLPILYFGLQSKLAMSEECKAYPYLLFDNDLLVSTETNENQEEESKQKGKHNKKHKEDLEKKKLFSNACIWF